MRYRKLGFILITLGAVVAGLWLTVPGLLMDWRLSPNAAAGQSCSGASLPEPSHAPDTKPLKTSAGSDPAIINLPDPELVDDLRTLIDSLNASVREGNYELAEITALKLRNSVAGGDDVDAIRQELTSAIRANNTEWEGAARVAWVSYLTLALPANHFETVLRLIRNNWTKTELSEDRAVSLQKTERLPIHVEFRNALVDEDQPLAIAIAYTIASAADERNLLRFVTLTDLALQTYLTSADNSPDILDFPDPWVSELVLHLSLHLRYLPPLATDSVRQLISHIAECGAFSERLRHQARLAIQQPPETLGALLLAIKNAKSDVEAGAALTKYLDTETLTQEDLLLLLSAIRGTPFASQSAVILGDALQHSKLLQHGPTLQRFALDALVLTSDPALSDIEIAQLSGAIQAAARAYLFVALPYPRSPSARRELLFQHVGAEARQHVLGLIKQCGADLELSVAQRKILFWEVAQMIIELDVVYPEKLNMMRDLISSYGTSLDPVSNTVLRTLIHAHVRESGFAEYCISMLEIFLDTRGVQPHLESKLALSEQASTLDLIVIIRDIYLLYPDMSLASPATATLRDLLSDANQLIRANANRPGAREAVEAMAELEQSHLLR